MPRTRIENACPADVSARQLLPKQICQLTDSSKSWHADLANKPVHSKVE